MRVLGAVDAIAQDGWPDAPHQFHALAALWPLHVAWPLLHHAAAAARLSAVDAIRSTTYGRPPPTGDHSDGAATALLYLG